MTALTRYKLPAKGRTTNSSLNVSSIWIIRRREDEREQFYRLIGIVKTFELTLSEVTT